MNRLFRGQLQALSKGLFRFFVPGVFDLEPRVKSEGSEADRRAILIFTTEGPDRTQMLDFSELYSQIMAQPESPNRNYILNLLTAIEKSQIIRF